jgi:hypothetical protein
MEGKKMKSLVFSIIILLILTSLAFSNGAAIVDATNEVYLRLLSSEVEVTVENQVAIIKATNVFLNDLAADTTVKYAFPMPEAGSATGLRWQVNGQWYQATITPQPPDTSLPGPGGPSPNLVSYLGETPLYFNVDQQIQKDSTFTVELTYVQLLHYEFGEVDFMFPNDYRLIQNDVLALQQLDFDLISSRNIENIEVMSSHPVSSINNSGNSAYVQCQLFEVTANENYQVRYRLDLNQLGLFDFSTFIPDSSLPDTSGGFLLFVAEPDPGNAAGVIDKVFTLIIDRSGSMSGNKIVQARDAASFIVDSLNAGDEFNIIDFATNVNSFRNHHVPYTPQTRDSALQYISGLTATNLTNISGAFDMAIPQFATANDSTANIIIFFTDGEATTGITNTQQLVDHIDQLVTTTETNVMIFCFGIGSYVNEQLLTLISSHNNGLAEFLKNDELYERITKFYLKIRNPVLLNTSISFNPPILHEIYPDPLPNLYKGQQMIVSARYLQSGQVEIDLSGTAFTQPVNYQYFVDLSDTAATRYQFLTKIWAKQKIENLLVQYYSYDPNSPEAQALKEQIVWLSVNYGVISPFTSFNPNPVYIEEQEESPNNVASTFELLGNFPNPFNSTTKILFRVNQFETGIAKIKIFNTLGQLVQILTVQINGSGIYEVVWDGTLLSGQDAPSGSYIYVIDFGNTILGGKMTLIK